MSTRKFVAKRVRDEFTIDGIADFLAFEGNGVVLKSTDTTNLALASGTRAHCLTRDIEASLSLEDTVFDTGAGFVKPFVQGGLARARKVEMAEIEGAERLHPSGTGAITPSTTADTELGWYQGKLREKQGSEETAGWLRAQLTPEFPEGGTARILVELV